MYTVLVPSRPREPYLLEGLRSIHSQSAPPAQVVVVINGPGAHDSPLVSSIAAAYPTVDVRTVAEPGMARALGIGLDTVTTEYVAVLDADDLWAPEKQERQLARLEADAGLDAVSCEAVNFQTTADRSLVEGTAAVTRMFSAVTFRTDAFDRFGRPDPAVSHFAWLVRWWTVAQELGITTEGLDYRGLWRRVHDTNGWIVDRERGRAHLLAELRRIHGARATEAASGALGTG